MPMSAFQFKILVGREPNLPAEEWGSEMQYVNCHGPSDGGLWRGEHQNCGICREHRMPFLACEPCQERWKRGGVVERLSKGEVELL